MNVFRKVFEKVAAWIVDSDRWKHFVGGLLIGAGANDTYCAAYAGVGVAGALELKDHLWGGKADWVDFAVTIAGVAVGHALRRLLYG
ncbi:MAG: hypothetical protein Q4E59_00690 [Bacteroidales bacterium]|nr:hypothetical protein [Bacteroidales bacterium]